MALSYTDGLGNSWYLIAMEISKMLGEPIFQAVTHILMTL